MPRCHAALKSQYAGRVIRGAWQAPAGPFLRNALSVLLRETGF
ncbi:hypothetical protein [Propionivibrio dicarboxylicus]|nr:hypothetical protein [Propionivibrio dicarboxylicus]